MIVDNRGDASHERQTGRHVEVKMERLAEPANNSECESGRGSDKLDILTLQGSFQSPGCLFRRDRRTLGVEAICEHPRRCKSSKDMSLRGSNDANKPGTTSLLAAFPLHLDWHKNLNNANKKKTGNRNAYISEMSQRSF